MPPRGPGVPPIPSWQWLLAGGAVLLLLQVYLLAAVLRLGRTHAADLRELARAAAVSREAAASAQAQMEAARRLFETLRASASAARPVQVQSPLAEPVAAVAAGPAKSPVARARLAFLLEKATSVAAQTPVLFHFSVQNTGGAAADRVRVWSAVKLVNAAQLPEFVYGVPLFERDQLASHAPSVRLIPYTEAAGEVAPLREEEYAQVQSGAAYLVAYGRAVWQDADGLRHWAQFCQYVTRPAAPVAGRDRCAAYNVRGVYPATAASPGASPDTTPDVPVVALAPFQEVAKAMHGPEGE